MLIQQSPVYLGSWGISAPVISGAIFPYGSDADAYGGFTPTLDSGGGTITWSVHSGALPTGLAISSTTGAITGTHSAAGSFTFTIKATNSGGDSNLLGETIEVTAANLIDDAPSDLTGAWWNDVARVTTAAATAFRETVGTALTETTANGNHAAGHNQPGESYASGGTYAVAAIVKQTGWSSDRLLQLIAFAENFSQSAYARFDVEAGTYSSSSATWAGGGAINGTPTITDLGSGYYFVRFFFDVGTTQIDHVSIYLQTLLDDGTAGYTGETDHSLDVVWADFYRSA